MNDADLQSAALLRARLMNGHHSPRAFFEALTSVPAADRDAWANAVLGLDDVPDDGPALPKGGVPYLPCSVAALLRVVELARVTGDDTFVDIGSGPGRAATLVHLLTGAPVVGLEVQPALVKAAHALASRLHLERVVCVEGDAAALVDQVTSGTVFFLYCPFGGERLSRVLAALEAMARTRLIRVCFVDLPIPPCAWLEPVSSAGDEVAVYRSRHAPRAERGERQR